MAYMPRIDQQFSFHDLPYEYQPSNSPQYPSTNSSFNSDQSYSMQEEKTLVAIKMNLVIKMSN